MQKKHRLRNLTDIMRRSSLYQVFSSAAAATGPPVSRMSWTRSVPGSVGQLIDLVDKIRKLHTESTSTTHHAGGQPI